MKRHLGIKIHKCCYNECDQSFVTTRDLKARVKKEHKKHVLI
jgi:hypothetical protein